jgi:hypothetical protein
MSTRCLAVWLFGTLNGACQGRTAARVQQPPPAQHLQVTAHFDAGPAVSESVDSNSDAGGPKTRCGTKDLPWVWPASLGGVRPRRNARGERRPITAGTVVPWQVEVGQVVTFVAEPWTLPPQQLVVGRVVGQPAADEFPPTWVIDADATATPLENLEPPGTGDRWSVPGVMVCPATTVRIIARNLVGDDLPVGTGVSLRTLWVALDTRGEGRPDVELFNFWCDRPDVPITEPPSSVTALWCRAMYRRLGGKHWKLVDEERDD